MTCGAEWKLAARASDVVIADLELVGMHGAAVEPFRKSAEA